MDASAVSVADMALIGINAESIAYAYAWGFGAIVSTWAIGFAVGVAVTLIRKL